MARISKKEQQYLDDVKFLFNTETGQRVSKYWLLSYVLNKTGANPDTHTMAYDAGQRDFVLSLIDDLTINPDILKAILAQQQEEDYDE